MKKLKANISVSIIVFFMSLLALCACGVDASYVVISRYKLQKITESMAQVMAAELKSQNAEDRNIETLTPIVTDFSNLYASRFSGLFDFRPTEIDFRQMPNGNVRVRLSTQASIMSYFLRFVGVHSINLNATSHAAASAETYPAIDFNTENSATFDLADTLTSKQGQDIDVTYNEGYFIYAGYDGAGGNRVWADIGCKTNNETKIVEINDGYSAVCVNGNASFDLNTPCNEPNNNEEVAIGLVRFIRIYRDANNVCGYNPAPVEGEEPPNTPVAIRTLNSVRLIRRADY